MKKSFNIMAVFGLVIAIGASSCKKDSSSVPQSNATGFRFKLDGGSSLTIDSSNAQIYTNGGMRMIDVYAFKGGQEVLEFHFAPTTGMKVAGTTLGTGAFLTYLSSPINSFDSQSGSLNLTTCDTIGNKIEGDFNFVGKEYPYSGSASKTISEGHMIVTNITK